MIRPSVPLLSMIGFGIIIIWHLEDVTSNTIEFWFFWFYVASFAMITWGFSTVFVPTVVVAPKVWREKAQSASKHLEGGAVLVLESGVGGFAIPFAEQVVRRETQQDVVFVCIDRFSAAYSWPYSPRTLLKNLSAVGIPPQSIIAHRASGRRGSKDRPTSLIQYDDLPFLSNSFSLVISNQALGEYRRPPKSEGYFYEEVIRVLRPGGRAIIAEIVDMQHLIPECKQKGWRVEDRARGGYWLEYIKAEDPMVI